MIFLSHFIATEIKLVSSYINVFRTLDFEIIWSYLGEVYPQEPESLILTHFFLMFLFNRSWNY